MKPASFLALGAATIVIGVLAATWVSHLVFPPIRSQLHRLQGGAGDEPITMAGGSMYFSTSPVYCPTLDTCAPTDDDFYVVGNDLVHKGFRGGSLVPTKFYVTTVQVQDPMGVTHPFTFDGTKQASVDITFCKLNVIGVCSATETVRFITTSLNQGLTLTSIPGTATTFMSNSVNLFPHLWLHPRRKKTITDISITGYSSGTPLPSGICLPDGDCEMVIHYCVTNADCSH